MAVASFGGDAISSLQNALGSGAGRADAAVSSAQSGVAAVLGAGPQINADANGIRNQAGMVNAQGNALNATAGQVKDMAGQMLPYANQVGGMGDQLWKQGSALYEQANDVFGQGGALVSMDPSKGGLSAQFINYWKSLSPDRYVSQAASDTQSAFNNAEGQAMRDLARRGVSAGSGSAEALGRQYAALKAVALAAAKTKARQVGLDQQAAELDKMVGAAKTMYDMGSESASGALAAQNAGVGAKNAAAGIVGNAGDLTARAGSLEASAGQLFGTAGDLLKGAAGVTQTYANSLQGAYKDLAGAQQAAANYFAHAAQIEVGANTSGGGGGGRGGSVTFPTSTTLSNSSLAQQLAAGGFVPATGMPVRK